MIPDDKFAPVVIDLGSRAQSASRAILWIRSDIEINHGHEVICTVRFRAAFRPERLAVLAACAASFDLVDFKVARCSAPDFVVDIPAIRYATAYELRPRPIADAWISGPHRAIVSDETRLGRSISSRVCPAAGEVAVTVRHCPNSLPTALEVIVLGTVLSEVDGYQTYLREQQVMVHPGAL